MSKKVNRRINRVYCPKVRDFGLLCAGISLVSASPVRANSFNAYHNAQANFASLGAGHLASPQILHKSFYPGHSAVAPTLHSVSAFTPYNLPSTPAGAMGVNVIGLPPVALDLQSTASNIYLGRNLFAGKDSVAITINGQKQTFYVGQKVTAAEYVALTEVLTRHNQTLHLSQNGTASGGSFNLSGLSSTTISSLVVPANVIAIDDVATKSGLIISGDLLNYGSIYAYSSKSHVSSGQIVAGAIVNENGGLISTQLSGSLVQGANSTASKISLSLSSSHDLVNNGTIVAGGSLDLTSGSGVIVNSGIVKSVSGDITLNSLQPTSHVAVHAVGGTFQAAKGDIDIRTESYRGAANVQLDGGYYLSQNLNIFSGTGIISGDVGRVSGKLNSQAAIEHLNTSTPNLIMGTNNVSGDPTFANDGNITISGANTFGEDVTIIANGDITATSGAAIQAPGHNVTLLAGVSPGTSASLNDTVSGGAGGAASDVVVDFSSAANKGGNIDFRNGAASVVIDTTAASVGTQTGDITLAAFGSGGVGGRVLLAQDSFVNAGGNISIMAGAAPATVSTTVQLGTVSSAGGGNIAIATAQPQSTSGTTIGFGLDGAPLAGAALAASASTSANAQVSAGSVSANNINVRAGSTITLANVSASDTFSFNTAGDVYVNNAGTATLAASTGHDLHWSGNALSTGGSSTLSGALFSNTLIVNGSDAFTASSYNMSNSAGVPLIFSVTDAGGAVTATKGDIDVIGAPGTDVSLVNVGHVNALVGNILIVATPSANGAVTGGSIFVQGNGSISTNSGNATIIVNPSTNDPSTNNIVIAGSQNFQQNLYLTAGGTGQTIQINNGVVLNTANVNLTSGSINLVGSGTVVASTGVITVTSPPTVTTSGAVTVTPHAGGGGTGGGANTQQAADGTVITATGSLDLSNFSSLSFVGGHLAIVAGGAITDNGKSGYD